MMQKLFIEKQKEYTIQKLNKYVENLNENEIQTIFNKVEDESEKDKEEKDIIFKGLSYSTVVKDYYNRKLVDALEYDEQNPHQLYKKLPSWLLEDEENNETKNLKQINPLKT